MTDPDTAETIRLTVKYAIEILKYIAFVVPVTWAGVNLAMMIWRIRASGKTSVNSQRRRRNG